MVCKTEWDIRKFKPINYADDAFGISETEYKLVSLHIFKNQPTAKEKMLISHTSIEQVTVKS